MIVLQKEKELNADIVIPKDVLWCPKHKLIIAPEERETIQDTNPIVVMKLVVKEPSENLRSKQLFPTPTSITIIKCKELIKDVIHGKHFLYRNTFPII